MENIQFELVKPSHSLVKPVKPVRNSYIAACLSTVALQLVLWLCYFLLAYDTETPVPVKQDIALVAQTEHVTASIAKTPAVVTYEKPICNGKFCGWHEDKPTKKFCPVKICALTK